MFISCNITVIIPYQQELLWLLYSLVEDIVEHITEDLVEDIAMILLKLSLGI